MRQQLSALHPTAVADAGLVQALERHCARLQAQFGLPIELEACDEPPLTANQREILYYIAREALWNVVKHACARRVQVLLAEEEEAISLSVIDDGAGFDPAIFVLEEARGLRSMHERATQLGGTFALESSPGHGTRITVTLKNSLTVFTWNSYAS